MTIVRYHIFDQSVFLFVLGFYICKQNLRQNLVACCVDLIRHTYMYVRVTERV